MRTALLAVRRFSNSFVHLPHLFAQGGFEVDVVCGRKNYIQFSRWIRRRHFVEDDDRQFSRKVRELALTGEYHFVQLADEPALTAVYNDPASEQINQWLPIPFQSELAHTIGRKDLFHDWCDRHGVPTPRTTKASSPEETLAACEAAGFPAVIKGISGSGGLEVFFVKSPEEAMAAMDRVKKDGRWLVQEAVSGNTGGGVFLSVKGRLKAWFDLTKLTSMNKGKGPLLIASLGTNPAVRRICERVSEAGQLNCLTGFDYMTNARGEPLLIDPHFGRSVSTPHFSEAAGVYFGKALAEALEGDPRVHGPSPTEVRLVKYPESLDFAFREGIGSLLRCASPFDRRNRYRWMPPGDWKLFSVMTAETVRSNLRILGGRWLRKIRGKSPP